MINHRNSEEPPEEPEYLCRETHLEDFLEFFEVEEKLYEEGTNNEKDAQWDVYEKYLKIQADEQRAEELLERKYEDGY